MIKRLVIFLVILVGMVKIFAIETIFMKTGESYSASLVIVDDKNVVFLIQKNRFELDKSQLLKIDFSKSDGEFEIILDDNSSIKASIVDQDDEFYTIGSSAGITPIEKRLVKQIKNPVFKEFYNPPKKYFIDFHYGNVPYTTFILNNFSKSYQAFWSYENYFESNFFLKVYFGFDVKFIMLTPQFNIYNDFIFLIPVNFTIKYQDNFYHHKDPKHWSNNLFWHIKGGFGFAVITLYEKSENISNLSIGISSELDYGIKYYINKSFGVGINGKTDIIAQENSMILMQSAGVVLEVKF